ncbi:hypothetical protein GGR51DRAFT_564297 [Nemania sp. FL0031]|nr:hypothetical protein GGR51DRAFT_564297 [Nemania sp. FL0031]
MSYSKFSQKIKHRAEEPSTQAAENAGSRYVIPHKRVDSSDSRNFSLRPASGPSPPSQLGQEPQRTRHAGTDRYRNPYSRGGGKNIPAAKLSEYTPPAPLEIDKTQEWNKGDKLPNGGPLPFDRIAGTVIVAHRAYGAGTFADPMVLFSNKEVEVMERRHQPQLNEHITFAKKVARDLGFSHIWIRKASHDLETKRNRTTGLFVRETKQSQSHITVMLGNTEDWVYVGGHIFVLVITDKVSQERMEYMSSEELWPLASGERRRVVELWKWDEGDSLKKDHKSKAYREKETWRNGS